MSPHYDRQTGLSEPGAQNEFGGGPVGEAMDDAAEALRQVEVESVQPEASATDRSQLENMSIDQLRKLAAELDVPDRGTITEQDQLIAAIRRRM